jgi:hypothetical protein
MIAELDAIYSCLYAIVEVITQFCIGPIRLLICYQTIFNRDILFYLIKFIIIFLDIKNMMIIKSNQIINKNNRIY